MSDVNFGEMLRPLHCRVSVSEDKAQLALTFECKDRPPVSIVLPMAGAVGLQRKLAQSLYILGVRPPAKPAQADVKPPQAEVSPVPQVH
jgi:hypothetical protein